MARRPMLAVAVVFMCGIALHRTAPLAPSWWIAGLALCAIAALPLRGVAGTLLLAAGVACGGIAAAQIASYRYSGREIAALASDEPRPAELELRLLQPPRLLTYPWEAGRPLPPKQVTLAEALRVRTRFGWQEASGRLVVQVLEPHPELAVGQTVRAMGLLQRPGLSMNPGQFDWAGYYREQRTLASYQIPHAESLTILTSPAPGPLTWLREQVRRLLAAGFDSEQALDHALLRALLLGDADPELRDVQDDFRRTGTSHHLAISGLHVAVLGGFVLLVCRVLLMPPRWALALTLAFVVLYGLVALPSPPVVRSVLLCLAVALGRLAGRSIDAIQLLALSVVAMLVYHPLDLMNPGFQLSFGTVMGLMLLTGPLAGWLSGPPDPDVQALIRSGRTGRAAALVWRFDRRLTSAIAAGIVAWVVSMPLIALHFEQMNPWAIAAGLILAPLVLAALVCGLLKIILTLLWPGMAGVWAPVAAGPISATRHVVDWLAAVPGSDVPVPSPAWWVVGLFYAALLLALVRFSSPTLRWLSRAAAPLAVLGILALPFHAPVAQASRSSGDLRITLLAVGAGQCAVIEPPSGRVMLIDAGSTSVNDLLLRCLGPYLRHRGITDIDSVVLTHANYDHFSAAADVARAFDVREVMVGRHFTGHAAANPPAAALLEELGRLHRPPRIIAPGQSIPLGRDSALEVLWPPPEEDLDSNNASLALRITHGSRRILVTGDMQESALQRLVDGAGGDALRADVLVAPHHGSAEPSTAAFVRAVDPRCIIASDGRSQSARQRQFDELAAGRALYRTHQWGAVTVTIDADGAISISTHLPDPLL